jgi:hypothetical protein
MSNLKIKVVDMEPNVTEAAKKVSAALTSHHA